MSKPRPFHTLPRDLRSTPDEKEPSHSYEQESFLGGKEVDVEDEFHRKLAAGPRREGGNSFWRTSTAGESSQTPSLMSVSLRKEKTDSVKERTSLLSGAMQQYESPGQSDRMHSRNGSDSVREHVSCLFVCGVSLRVFLVFQFFSFLHGDFFVGLFLHHLPSSGVIAIEEIPAFQRARGRIVVRKNPKRKRMFPSKEQQIVDTSLMLNPPRWKWATLCIATTLPTVALFRCRFPTFPK